MKYRKPNIFLYRIAQCICWLVSKILYKNKVLRNEIRGQKGPFVVIANHQTALDFVNLICASARPMSFVISRSFFSTLPIQGYLHKMGVIPKQQFQTTVKDMKQMKTVVEHGEPLVIYPAGLMCEDGLSTPIPSATYKFLKWLGVDVYVARSYGSYFVMPKWTGVLRPGKTYIDIHKLLSKEDLEHCSLDELKKITDEALLFDAYREQEQYLSKYAKNDNLKGIENVLYQCPHCGSEFTVTVRQNNMLQCTACGYAQVSDSYGFLHNEQKLGPELRYVSDWSRNIFLDLKKKVISNPAFSLSDNIVIKTVNNSKHRFEESGTGKLTLSAAGFELEGTLHGEPFTLTVPVGGIPTLPFSPGKHLEIQHGNNIYRCVPEDRKLVMKFINLVKIYYELQSEEISHTRSKSIG